MGQPIALLGTSIQAETGAVANSLAQRDSLAGQTNNLMAMTGLLLSGYLQLNSVPITSSGTLAVASGVVYCDCTSGAITLTMPTSPTVGRCYFIQKRDAANNLTLSSSANINGSTTYAMNTQYNAAFIHWDGTTWSILAKF